LRTAQFVAVAVWRRSRPPVGGWEALSLWDVGLPGNAHDDDVGPVRWIRSPGLCSLRAHPRTARRRERRVLDKFLGDVRQFRGNERRRNARRRGTAFRRNGPLSVCARHSRAAWPPAPAASRRPASCALVTRPAVVRPAGLPGRGGQHGRGRGEPLVRCCVPHYWPYDRREVRRTERRDCSLSPLRKAARRPATTRRLSRL